MCALLGQEAPRVVCWRRRDAMFDVTSCWVAVWRLYRHAVCLRGVLSRVTRPSVVATCQLTGAALARSTLPPTVGASRADTCSFQSKHGNSLAIKYKNRTWQTKMEKKRSIYAVFVSLVTNWEHCVSLKTCYQPEIGGLTQADWLRKTRVIVEIF